MELLLCVQCYTPHDGQRYCSKHVEFHSKNKFEKLVHLVGFIIRKEITFRPYRIFIARSLQNGMNTNIKLYWRQCAVFSHIWRNIILHIHIFRRPSLSQRHLPYVIFIAIQDRLESSYCLQHPRRYTEEGTSTFLRNVAEKCITAKCYSPKYQNIHFSRTKYPRVWGERTFTLYLLIITLSLNSV